MIIWLASFPRSGNTFFRTLLHALYGQNTYAAHSDPEIGAMDVTAGEEPPAPLEELARREQVYFIKNPSAAVGRQPSNLPLARRARFIRLNGASPDDASL
jgi:hypothetical protein